MGGYHGVHASLVAGLDEQLDVRVHERNSHGDIAAVRQDKLGVVSELLDDGEDVIPATTVEAGAVLAELVDDLLHLESGENGLNQHGSTDGTAGDRDRVLGEVEDVVPKASLEVRLELGKVEVRAAAVGNERLGVVEKVQAKVEEGSRDGGAVDSEVLLLEVPSTGTVIVSVVRLEASKLSIPDNQGGKLAVGAELVVLAGELKVNLAADGVVKVDLAVDDVVPRGRVRVCRHQSAPIPKTPATTTTHPRNRPCRSTHRRSEH